MERKTQDLNEQPLKSQRNFIHSTVTLKHSCLWGGNRRDLVGFGKTGIFTWALGAWGGGPRVESMEREVPEMVSLTETGGT